MSLQPQLTNPGHAEADIHDQENHLCEEHIKNSQKSYSDYPPESFWLSKDSERDWFDQNAAMQRNDSLKFAFSGKYNHKKSKLLSHHSFSSLNKKPTRTSLFSLPKTRKSSSADGNPRANKLPKSRFRRSRSEPRRKMMMHVPEPGSPKVSCTGMIRSKSKIKDREKRTGLWKKVKAILKSRSGTKGVASVRSEPESCSGLKRLPTRRCSDHRPAAGSDKGKVSI